MVKRMIAPWTPPPFSWRRSAGMGGLKPGGSRRFGPSAALVRLNIDALRSGLL